MGFQLTRVSQVDITNPGRLVSHSSIFALQALALIFLQAHLLAATHDAAYL